MKKSWIIAVLALVVVAGAFYRLTSSKAAIEAELAARKRVVMSVPVTVVPAKETPVARTIRVEGVLSSDRLVRVLSETSGQVLQVYKDVGDAVQTGTSLALVDSKVIAAQLEMARVSLANNERDLERFQKLQAGGAASQQNVDNLRLAVESSRSNVVALEKQLANTVVKSPMSGVVTARSIEVGSVLGGGSATFTVADLGAMNITVGLTEKEVAQVRAGMAVDVYVPSLSKTYPGTVKSVGVVADLSGRYSVNVILKKYAKGELRPDLNASAEFALPSMEGMPVIPRRALVGGIRDPKVFVLEGDKARLRPIHVALATEGELVVSAGIADGDKVVVTGQINLVDGTQVQVME